MSKTIENLFGIYKKVNILESVINLVKCLFLSF